MKGSVVSAVNISAPSIQALRAQVGATDFGYRVDQQNTLYVVNPKKESSVTVKVGNQAAKALIFPPLARAPLTREMTKFQQDVGMRWEPQEANPYVMGPNARFVQEGFTPMEPVCVVAARDGSLLIRKSIQATWSGNSNGCFLLCPEDDKSGNARLSPTNAAACKGEKLEKQICFAARLTATQGQIGCNVHIEITGRELEQ